MTRAEFCVEIKKDTDEEFYLKVYDGVEQHVIPLIKYSHVEALYEGMKGLKAHLDESRDEYLHEHKCG